MVTLVPAALLWIALIYTPVLLSHLVFPRVLYEFPAVSSISSPTTSISTIHATLDAIHATLDTFGQVFSPVHFPLDTNVHVRREHALVPDAFDNIVTALPNDSNACLSASVSSCVPREDCTSLSALPLFALLLLCAIAYPTIECVQRESKKEIVLSVPTIFAEVQRPDRARVLAEVPPATPPHTPARTNPRHLFLVPASPTPAGATVHRIELVEHEAKKEIVLAVPTIPADAHKADRARVLTEVPPATPLRTSARVRTRTDPDYLTLPASPTPSGAVVHRIELVQGDETSTKTRVQSPRILTEVPSATAPRASARARTRTAPGHLLLAPSSPTPAGAAVQRILPLPPLQSPPVSRVPPPPPPTEPIPVMIYQTSASLVAQRSRHHAPTTDPISRTMIYETSPSLVAQRARAQQPSRIPHHRSGPPTRTYPPYPPYYHLDPNAFMQTEAQRCEYRRRMHLLSIPLGRAPGVR
ncbi:hypothetical protein C8R44DRAFT_746506 [Mycena epipterygia]|nr:hypothetical protein C8R44DRAFT_746506 [Mycena epipterygia]